MLSRTVGNVSALAFKTVQGQSRLRFLHASAVTFKDNSVIDQAKEKAQNIVDKAKETYESVKDKVEAQELTNKINETFENAKESVANAAKAVGGQNLAEKASCTVEQAKEMAQNLRSKIDGPNITESAKEMYEQVKDKAQDLKDSVMGGGPGSGTSPSASGKSSTYDPRGSQEDVAKLIHENKKEFSEFDKKHGGDGKYSGGGFDPVRFFFGLNIIS
uniref:Uncharacterized protein n=1 Tax=Panagrolaimus superbus TaxID=310955 RepID=A0A914Y158_9BILA